MTDETGITDSGDQQRERVPQPDAPTPWVGAMDAAYWQKRAEALTAEVDRLLRILSATQDARDAARVERDAALAQCAALKEQLVGAESRCATLSKEVTRRGRILQHDAQQTVRGRPRG